MTAETRTSFKGYYRVSAGKNEMLIRSFLQFEGEGDTANARERAIGGHPAVVLKVQCRRKDPDSAHADEDGYVPFGTLVNYSGGRSNGCTTWTPADSEKIFAMAQDRPTTLYIYPESDDIDGDRASGEGRPVAVARRIILERFLLERKSARRNSGRKKPSSRSSLNILRRIVRRRRRSRCRFARGSEICSARYCAGGSVGWRKRL